MKHFRWLSLLIVVLLLSAWTPAPQLLSSGNQSVLALTAPPILRLPKSGSIYKNSIDPSLNWKPTFVWNNTGAPSYRIQLSTTSLFSVLMPSVPGYYVVPGNANISANPTISFTWPDELPGNARLYWRVKTDTDADRWSLPFNFYTMPKAVTGADISPRVDPIVGGVAQAQAIRPTFSWNKSNNVRTYVLRLASDDLCTVAVKTFSFSYASVALTPDLIQYTPLADLPLNTTYTWCVQSRGLAAGIVTYSNWSTPLKFITPAQLPPQPKILLTPKNSAILSNYRPNFTWTPVGDSSIHYIFQLATKPTFAADVLVTPPTEGIDPGNLATASLTLNADLPTGIYYWHVRSIDANGQQSNWSPTFMFKTPATLIVHVWDSLLTDQGIEGATVSISSFTIPAVPGNKTQAGGVFTLPSAPTGYRTIKIVMADYITQSKTTTIAPGTTRTINFFMKKVPIRIVLKWGAAPFDLDAHLWLPWNQVNDPDGNLRYHIYPGHFGNTLKTPWARLDKDAYGYTTLKTETITIVNRYPGTYYYGVYSNYSGSFNNMSGVSVTIYKNNIPSLPILLQPHQGDGLWWFVFTIDGATGVVTQTNPADAILTVSEASTTFPYEQTYGTALNKPK